MNGDGWPSFSSLQNSGDGDAAVLFYAFDVPTLAGEDLRGEPLAIRRRRLDELIASLPDTIRVSETFEASAAELMAAVRSNGLEGIVAKWSSDSVSKPDCAADRRWPVSGLSGVDLFRISRVVTSNDHLSVQPKQHPSNPELGWRSLGTLRRGRHPKEVNSVVN